MNVFQRINNMILFKKSNYIQRYCANSKVTKNATEIWEHTLLKANLPLGIVKKIKKYSNTLELYADDICNRYYPFTHPNLVFDKEILPPWVAFPLYDAFHIGWRMGTGEEYIETYIAYIRSLSETDYEKYCKKYPEPEYMSINCYRLNIINYDLKYNF